VYLNSPGICLKPPRSFRQSSFGSLFALLRSFFLLFFHTREELFVFLQTVFHHYKRTKPLSKSEPTTKSLRYTSLVFSLSLSLVLMRLCLFFVFFVLLPLKFFCGSLFFFSSSLHTHATHAFATPHEQRREKNTMVKITKSTNSLSPFSLILSLFSSFLSVVRRFPLSSSSRRKRDPFVEIGLGVLFFSQRGFCW